MAWTWATLRDGRGRLAVDPGSTTPALCADGNGLALAWVADPRPGSQTLRTSVASTEDPLGLFWSAQADRGPAWPTSLSPSTAALVSWGPGHLDAVARGNNHLFHWRCDNGRWTGPNEMPGEVSDRPGSSPAVVSPRPGRLDLFAITKAGDLSHWWLNDSQKWSGPETFDADLRPDVAPVAIKKIESTEGFDVLALDVNGGVAHWWYPAAGAFGTQPSLGAGAQSLAACVDRPGRLHAFTVDGQGTVTHWWWGAPGTSRVLPGRAAPDGLAGQSAVTWGPDRLDLFARAPNGALLHWWHNGSPDQGGWGSEELATQPRELIASAPVAVSRGPRVNRLDVVAWRADRRGLLGVHFGDQFRPPPAPPCSPTARVDEAGQGLVRLSWTYDCPAPADSFRVVHLGAEPFPSDDVHPVGADVREYSDRFDLPLGGLAYQRNYRVEAVNASGVASSTKVTAQWAPPAQPPPARGSFTFWLGGNFEQYGVADVVEVQYVPPGDPGTSMDNPRRMAMQRFAGQWQAVVPASEGGSGSWAYRWLVAGRFPQFGSAGLSTSEWSSHNWVERSPSVAAHLDLGGIPDPAWTVDVPLNS